jgi:hypothetical protein
MYETLKTGTKTLSLALLLLVLVTLGHAQSGNPSSNGTDASSSDGLVLNIFSSNASAKDDPSSGLNPAVSAGYCLYNGVDGEKIFRCYWNAISANSTVMAAVSEYRGGPLGRFIGSAIMTVHNIRPFNGGVDVVIDTGWGNPINVRMDLLVAQ